MIALYSRDTCKIIALVLCKFLRRKTTSDICTLAPRILSHILTIEYIYSYILKLYSWIVATIEPVFVSCKTFLIVLMFYGPFSPLGSCGARSVHLTTFFLGQAKRLTSTCAHSFARNWQLPFLNQPKGENDLRKLFHDQSARKNIARPGGDRTRPVECLKMAFTNCVFY